MSLNKDTHKLKACRCCSLTFIQVVAPKGAVCTVFVSSNIHQRIFFSNSSFKRFNFALLEQLNTNLHRISIPLQSCLQWRLWPVTSTRIFPPGQFSVDESCLHRWKLQRERLLKTPRNKRAQCYRPAAFPDIEKELAAWITEKRQGGIGVSTNVICLKAKSVTQKFGIAEESFKASKAGAMVLWNAMVFPYDEEQQLPKNFLRITKRNWLSSSAMSLHKSSKGLLSDQ